jgi:hypothetical protein
MHGNLGNGHVRVPRLLLNKTGFHVAFVPDADALTQAVLTDAC